MKKRLKIIAKTLFTLAKHLIELGKEFENLSNNDVPLVCSGYLPLEIQAHLKLEMLQKSLNMSDKEFDMIVRQLKTYRNN